MDENWSDIDIEERKSIECKVFETSFELIENYFIITAKGYLIAYQREYVRAQYISNGYLNWHNVMPVRLEGIKGLAYIEAIYCVRTLLVVAQTYEGFEDKQKLREIYELVKHLIELRENEMSPQFPSFCCYSYERHKTVINAWIEFRDTLFSEAPGC